MQRRTPEHFCGCLLAEAIGDVYIKAGQSVACRHDVWFGGSSPNGRQPAAAGLTIEGMDVLEKQYSKFTIPFACVK